MAMMRASMDNVVRAVRAPACLVLHIPILLSLLAAGGAAAIYSGNQQQTDVAIPRLEAAVVVDGVLDEPVWQQAALLTDFSQYAPVDGGPPTIAPRCCVWYSPTAIHFGIRAHAAPGTVRATLADRDKHRVRRSRPDLPEHVQRRPAGDGVRRQPARRADSTARWSEGTRTQGGGFSGLATRPRDAGSQSRLRVPVEGAADGSATRSRSRIPFKSLRYQPSRRRTGACTSSVASSSQGTRTAGRRPGARARRFCAGRHAQGPDRSAPRPRARPQSRSSRPRSTARPRPTAGATTPSRPEFGGNVRWGVTPNLTLNGTVNPDFSQVESDAGQFRFDPRQALFFPEKRPFFLDGIEQFATPNNLIYTRRVVAPLAAAKLTGKVSGTTVGLPRRRWTMRRTSATGDGPSGLQHPARPAGRRRAVEGAALVYTDAIDGDDSNRVDRRRRALRVRTRLYSLQLQGRASRTRHGDRRPRRPLWQAMFEPRTAGASACATRCAASIEDFRAAGGFIAAAGIAHAQLRSPVSPFGQPGQRRSSAGAATSSSTAPGSTTSFDGRHERRRIASCTSTTTSRCAAAGGSAARCCSSRSATTSGSTPDYALGPRRPSGREFCRSSARRGCRISTTCSR